MSLADDDNLTVYLCTNGHEVRPLDDGYICPHCRAEVIHTSQRRDAAVAKIMRQGEPVVAQVRRYAPDHLVSLKVSLADPLMVAEETGATEAADVARRWLDAIDDAIQPLHEAGEVATRSSRLAPGGSWILDAPDAIEARWGRDEEVAWACGEPLLIVAPPGVGKTTVAIQLVAAMLGIIDPEVLGFPVKPAKKVLYLAMDRPRQIQRAMRRLVGEEHRQVLDEKLVVWQGPPPQDLAADPHALEVLAANAGADVVVVDSLKDAAVKLSDDEVGGKVNRCLQNAVAAGIDVLVTHHQRKGQGGARPKTLEDVYGSTWITAGAGSVVLLWGEAGDLIVELAHLKQPAEPIGPLRVQHDHSTGLSTVVDVVDLMALAAGSEYGLTVRDAARAVFEKDDPTRNESEKARRRLERLADAGQLVRGVAPRLNGGKPPTVYRTVADALADGPDEQSRTNHAGVAL